MRRRRSIKAEFEEIRRRPDPTCPKCQKPIKPTGELLVTVQWETLFKFCELKRRLRSIFANEEEEDEGELWYPPTCTTSSGALSIDKSQSIDTFWDTTTLSVVEEKSSANEEIYGGQVEIWFGGLFGEWRIRKIWSVTHADNLIRINRGMMRSISTRELE